MLKLIFLIFYLILNIFPQFYKSAECFDFQCSEKSESNRNCFKCKNVSTDNYNRWRNNLLQMIEVSNRKRSPELTAVLQRKLEEGAYCCDIADGSDTETCSLIFSHGSKGGIPHYGMGCHKGDFWMMPICTSKNIGNRCCNQSHCNGPNITEIKFLAGIINSDYPPPVTTNNESNDKHNTWIIIFVSLLSVTVLGIIVFCIAWFYKFYNKRNYLPQGQFQNRNFYEKMHCFFKLFSFLRGSNKKTKSRMMDDITSFSESIMGHKKYDFSKLNSFVELTCSGSGAGQPLMTQRTVATDTTLIRAVGEGRYGTVWLGKWNEDNVAVKIFSTRDERSWDREKQIYQMNSLSHSNILRFVATDSRDNGLATELWLVTDYHENGSLYEYLSSHVLSIEQAAKMVRSITNGLAYLHNEINGTDFKPGIAHRDLKSRNILVKSCGECCIGDLGLAVRLNEDNSQFDTDRVGTRRYMAPEVILGRILPNNLHYNAGLEVFKKADIYSYSLVLWEIIRRCECPSLRILSSPYEMPYKNMVSNDPSIEEMKEVVCEKKMRPSIMQSWDNVNPLKEISRAIQESWFEEPASRLTIMRLKKIMANAWNEVQTLKMTVVDLSENGILPSEAAAINNYVYRYPFSNSTASTEFQSSLISNDIPNIVIKTKDSYCSLATDHKTLTS